MQNYRNARDEARLYNPIQLSREAYQAEQARKSGGPTIETKVLEKTYPQYRVDWSTFETGRGQVPKGVADMIIKRQREREAISQLSASNYGSLSQGAASIAGSFVGTLQDPINILAGFIPEARLTGVIPKAIQMSEGVAAGVTRRFAGGFVSNAVVNGAVLSPIVASLRSSLGDNPTWQEYAGDVLIGGAIGGAFSAVSGVISDSLGRRIRMKDTAETPAGKVMDIDRATHLTPEEKSVMINKVEQDPIDLTEQEIKFTNTNTQSQSALLAKSIADTYDNKPIFLDPIIEESGDEFNLSSIKKMQRQFSREAYSLYDEVDNVQAVNKDLMSRATIEQTGQGFTAKTSIGDVELRSGFFSSRRKAMRDLRTVVKEYSEINRPSITRLESGNYAAAYPTDTGALREVRGIGSTPGRAVQELNQIYDEAIANPRAFANKADDLRERVDLIEGDLQRARAFLNNDRAATAKLPEFSSELEPVLRGASKAYKNAMRDLRSLERREVRPKDLPAHTQRLRTAELDLEQARNNLQYAIDNAFKENERVGNRADIGDGIKTRQPRAVDTEDDFDAAVRRIDEAENPITVERRASSDEVNTRNEEHASSHQELNKYADELEAEIRDSNAYYLLDNDVRNTIDDAFEGIRNDVDIMQSEEFRDIIRNYIACERGLK